MRASPTTLRELRQQRALSLQAVGVLARIDPATVSKIESGQARATPQTIVRLARALGIGARRMQRICDAAWLTREERQLSEKSEELRRIDLNAMAGA